MRSRSVFICLALVLGAQGCVARRADRGPTDGQRLAGYYKLIDETKLRCMKEQGLSDYQIMIPATLEQKRYPGSMMVVPRYLFAKGRSATRNGAQVKALYQPVVFEGSRYAGCSAAAEVVAKAKDPGGARLAAGQLSPPLTPNQENDPLFRSFRKQFSTCMQKQGFRGESLFSPGNVAMEPILKRITAETTEPELEGLVLQEAQVPRALEICEPDWEEFERTRNRVRARSAN